MIDFDGYFFDSYFSISLKIFSTDVPPLSFNMMNSKLRIRTTWMWLTVVGAVDMCGVSILSDSYSREYRSLGYYLINRCKKYTTWYEYTTVYHSNPSLSNPSWRVTSNSSGLEHTSLMNGKGFRLVAANSIYDAHLDIATLE